MNHATPITEFVDDIAMAEDDPIIAPLVREQLEPLVGGRRDGGAGSGERALMRALMQDAVLCLVGAAAPANERAQLADEARCWVLSRSRDWIFAFENVCDALGIDPDYAREKLLAMAGGQRWGAPSDAEQATRREGCALRGVRGLRHGGQRPRKAIHFLSERRRRRRSVETVAAEN
jgi:hypothetical protein